MEITKIAVVGAFDRFNYGDLLFPLIIEQMLGKYGIKVPIDYYGLVKSDLSEYGGKPTKPLKDLFKPEELPRNSVLIMAGGDIIGSSWTTITTYVAPKPLGFMIKCLRKLFGSGLSDYLCQRFLLNKPLSFPFVIHPSLSPKSVKVAYNAVGGSALKNLCSSKKINIFCAFREVSYISVRDKITKQILDQLKLNIQVKLAPDSAILISEFYSPSYLESKVSHRCHHLINAHGGNYICVQVNKTYIKKALRSDFVTSLKEICKELRCGIILLPIGRANYHEDHSALLRLDKELKPHSTFAGKDLSIYEIMYLIAKSKLFIGTSLHGSITAVSYCVPQVGLYEMIPKLKDFIDTWGLIGVDSITDLLSAVRYSMSVEESTRCEKRSQLIKATYNNFEDMFKSVALI